MCVVWFEPSDFLVQFKVFLLTSCESERYIPLVGFVLGGTDSILRIQQEPVLLESEFIAVS